MNVSLCPQAVLRFGNQQPTLDQQVAKKVEAFIRSFDAKKDRLCPLSPFQLIEELNKPFDPKRLASFGQVENLSREQLVDVVNCILQSRLETAGTVEATALLVTLMPKDLDSKLTQKTRQAFAEAQKRANYPTADNQQQVLKQLEQMSPAAIISYLDILLTPSMYETHRIRIKWNKADAEALIPQAVAVLDKKLASATAQEIAEAFDCLNGCTQSFGFDNLSKQGRAAFNTKFKQFSSEIALLRGKQK